ncbi:hypothetical protein Cpir12675_003752 [Ceratocystis pirilliformis]|uniref:RING-type E3 ubiquitin transferase n=1 Tax=Ceratocystis pirilliformis TaxID=259994 RepID=A0ABR3Z103_9PEZI
MADDSQSNSGQPRSKTEANRSSGRSGNGNRGGRRGRGGQNKNREQNNAKQNSNAPGLSSKAVQKLPATKPAADDAASDSSEDVCFICANPVQHYSIAPCNHTTCHICSLRMRALYKTKDCAHCRTPSDYVIFTNDPDKKYQDYADSDISSSDSNIGIRYVDEDIVGDTVLLLRYNCPDPDCDYAGLGLPDLHRHVKSTHSKKMCDLCTRNKKVFTHEHVLYEHRGLETHMRKGDDKPGAVDQSGFKGHPICGFCNERFYDDDKLFEHCRNKHERCFICDRQNSRQPHYFEDYERLEKHFMRDHFLCLDRNCMEKKFVVFESEVDLKAHQLEEHGNTLSKDVRRDARVVDMSNFDYRQSYQAESQGGRNRRAGRGGHGRDPNAEVPIVTPTHHMRRDEAAFHRQLALRNGESSRPQSQPSAPASRPPPSRPAPPASALSSDPLEPVSNVDVSSMSPQQRLKLSQHQTVIERASGMLGNDRRKLQTFREHVSSYKNRTLEARDFLDSLFTLCSDCSANAISTLVRELAELYEDPERTQNLRNALQAWRAVNEDYPSLPGLSGMHGATTSSSGWANAVSTTSGSSRGTSNQTSNRLMKLKNITRLGGPAPVQSSSVATWVAPSSNSGPPLSSAFPALPSSSSSSSARPTAANAPRPITVRPTARNAAGEDAFPALPAAPKVQTTIFGYGRGAVRRDFGVNHDTGFSWTGGNDGSSSQASGNFSPVVEEGPSNGKKKKGKKAFKPLII